MNELQIFNFNAAEVRTVIIDGAPWWVAKDICAVFGDTNYRRSIASLDDDEKGVSQIKTVGGMQKMTVVNESGLYSLLFAMQPKKARGVSDEYIVQREKELRTFRRWVTHEVLPSIRKTGGYIPACDGDMYTDILTKAMVIANKTIAEQANRRGQLQSANHFQIIEGSNCE